MNGRKDLKAGITIEASILVPLILAVLFLLLQTVLYFHDTVCAQSWLYQESWKLRWNEAQGQTVFEPEQSPAMAVLRHREDQQSRQWQKIIQHSVWQVVLLPDFITVLWNGQPDLLEGRSSESIRHPWDFLKISGAVLEEWKEGGS